MVAAKVFCVGVLVILLAGMFGEAWAQVKPTESCEDRLNVELFTLRNVADDRSAKDRALAREQVRVYWLQQEVKRLKEELAKRPPAPATGAGGHEEEKP